MPHATNNEAEYEAVAMGLKRCAQEGRQNVKVRGDSKLVIEQLQGRMAVKAPNLAPVHARARSSMNNIPKVRLEHVRREYNSQADKLANRAVANPSRR